MSNADSNDCFADLVDRLLSSSFDSAKARRSNLRVAASVPSALVYGIHALCGAVNVYSDPRIVATAAFIGRLKKWLDLPALERAPGASQAPDSVPLSCLEDQFDAFLEDLRELANSVGFTWGTDLVIMYQLMGMDEDEERAVDSLPVTAGGCTEKTSGSVHD